MPIANLNRETIALLALPAGKKTELFWDQTLKGFALKIHADAGGRIKSSFIVQYRIGSQQRKQKLGDLAKLNVDQARKRATELLAKVTLGVDPAAEKDAARAASAITLRSVVDQYLEMKEHAVREGNHRASSFKVTRLYLTGKGYFGPLHSTAINAITRAAIATRLNAMILNNGASTASRARAHLSAFFAWAMQQGIADANPVIGTANPDSGPARDRVLSNDELRAVWNACNEDDYGRIVRLLILTGCRRSEIGGLKWSEIDLEQGMITIPGERTKNHRAHTLALPDMALDIIRSIPQQVSRDFLFGVRGEGFTRWQHCRLDDGISKPWTLHDLRRTCVTGMADLGIGPHIVEAVVNHVSGHKGGVAGIYNRATYAKPMQRALLLWSEHIRGLIDGEAPKVVAFPAA